MTNAAADADAVLAAVTAAAYARSAALRRGDRAALDDLLHPEFRWTSPHGEVLDRAAYLTTNCGGDVHWHDQRLAEIDVAVVDRVAVLTAVATDLLSRQGEMLRHRVCLTLTWICDAEHGWRCLAGHAGQLEPRQP